jgi:hypothetical protein
MSRPTRFGDDLIAEVKRRFALFQGNRPKAIAKDFGLRPQNIRHIVNMGRKK